MNRHLRTLNLVAAAALWAGLAAPAHAQALINHSKALAGAVTPGDAPGYPITISRAGHYKLSGNLTVPAGVNGIEITASHVTLDLNGFTVSGPGQCSWNFQTKNVVCSGGIGGGLMGIAAQGGASQFVLRNGGVRGFNIGVYTGNSARLADLTVTENTHDGIMMTPNENAMPVVERTSVALNVRHGIYLDGEGLVRAVAASRNGGDGVFGAGNSIARVVDSFMYLNRGRGVYEATVQGTQLSGNSLHSRSLLRSAGGNADDAGVF